MKKNHKKKAQTLTRAERIIREKENEQIRELSQGREDNLPSPDVTDLQAEIQELDMEREERESRKKFFDEKRMNEDKLERIKSQARLDDRVVRLYEETRDGIPTSDEYRQELLSPEIPFAEVQKAVRLGTQEWIATSRSKEF